LRRALRLSVRGFAEHLGVAPRTVTKWESLGIETAPRPDTQAILDTALGRADAEAKLRFELLLADGSNSPLQGRYRTGPRAWDYETGTDDIGRAAACLARQDFKFAASTAARTAGAFLSSSLTSWPRLISTIALISLAAAWTSLNRG
jgi:transcriptional regulator with XRE-family HTH domain